MERIHWRIVCSQSGSKASITEEIKKALDSMAKAKAAGPDGIVVEMLSALVFLG